MASVATKTVTVAKVATAAKIDLDTVGLLQRIGEVKEITLAHPHVKNKSDQGVASRVARILNREKTFKAPQGEPYWTGALVSAFEAKHASKK